MRYRQPYGPGVHDDEHGAAMHLCGAREQFPFAAHERAGQVKMRWLFEEGAFDEDIAYHRSQVDAFRQRQVAGHLPSTEEEELLREDFAETKGLDLGSIGIDTPFFELGFTSLDLIRLKRRISNRLGSNVPTVTLIRNPTVRALAAISLGKDSPQSPIGLSPAEAPGPSRVGTNYDPVVVLRANGSKTPLWLVHPGVGEVLVFVGLAQHMKADGRCIYALRARRFETGEPSFTSIAEAVDIYVASVRRKQPQGPYAIAGYSYGAMLAFEMAKKLEAAGKTVDFLASFNLPPYIKHRMRQLTWNMCLLHLAQFLGLLNEATVEQMAGDDAAYRRVSRSEALHHVLALADLKRLQELGLEETELLRWADVAYGLQSMAVDYEPIGCVSVLDVFVAEPLRVAASSRHEWTSLHLSRWRDFCKTEPCLHDVDGGHYTMIGSDHVAPFSTALRKALKARGL
ncbi:hypothetical protein SLS62_010855 [Diatrype stigma]|uniref:Carrier domain-containing protein n=1 Tax=Diatrype stigma TaxID=117547 RepID=A0AAN9U7C2_9PEZI